MKNHCNSHPTRLAHWNCAACGAYFCPDCISERDGGGFGQKTLHFCPKCNLPAEWVGVSNLIGPFWKRMPRIFAYPFSPAPLILMCVMAVASFIFSGPGLIMTLIRAVFWLMVLKYSFESLKGTASGNLKPPPFNANTVSDDIHLVFKQFLIYFLIFLGFGYVSAKTGLFLSSVFLIIAFFFIPSMIILLVTSSSLRHALNPVVFVGLTFRIGWAYLLMYFFLFLLGTAPAFLAHYILRLFPNSMDLMLFNFAKSFYTIVSYHLMGYVILQYHDRIGFQVDYEDFQDPSTHVNQTEEVDPDLAVLNVVNPLIQDGKLDEAIVKIKEMTNAQGIKGINLSERYYNLLKMRKRTKELLGHGTNHLDLLVAKNHKTAALKVFSECSQLKLDLLPSADALFKLGSWMNETGKHKEALGVYTRLVKSYPQNHIVPKTYFRVAQIFHDRLMNADKAKKMLGALKQKYPEHDIIPQVENYLASI
jgi:tetratricopeptide (TPR) repeat protein